MYLFWNHWVSQLGLGDIDLWIACMMIPLTSMEILLMRNSSEIAYMQIVIQNKKLQQQFWVSSIFNVPVKIRMVFVTVIIGIN